MVLGDGGAMKSGVKVGLFLKKHPVGSKGAELALLCLQKEFTKKYTNIDLIYFQSASAIYCLGFR